MKGTIAGLTGSLFCVKTLRIDLSKAGRIPKNGLLILTVAFDDICWLSESHLCKGNSVEVQRCSGDRPAASLNGHGS